MNYWLFYNFFKDSFIKLLLYLRWKIKTLSVVFCKFCSLGFNLSSIKRPGVGSIMSLIIFSFFISRFIRCIKFIFTHLHRCLNKVLICSIFLKSLFLLLLIMEVEHGDWVVLVGLFVFKYVFHVISDSNFSWNIKGKSVVVYFITNIIVDNTSNV